jgi:uncharacterized membrane protein
MLSLAGTEAWLEWILRVLGIVSFSLAIWGVILFGIRRLRKEGVTIKNSILPVSGMLVCILFVFLQGYMRKVSVDLFEVLEIQDCNVAKLDQRLASGEIDMETYSEVSLIMAQNRFLKDGSITEYTSSEGQRVLFEPNELDRQFYVEMHQARDLFAKLSKSSYWGVYFWSAIALSSTILGIVTKEICGYR